MKLALKRGRSRLKNVQIPIFSHEKMADEDDEVVQLLSVLNNTRPIGIALAAWRSRQS